MRSAETEGAGPAISSNLPLPISVAGSGRSLRCVNSPTISAPALLASSLNSSSDSLELKSGESVGRESDEDGDDEAATLAACARAACAPEVMVGALALPLPERPPRPL